MPDSPTVTPAHVGRILTARLTSAIVISLAVAGGLTALYAVAPVASDQWSLLHFTIYAVVCLFFFITVTVAAVVRLSRSRHPLVTGMAFVIAMATILVLSYSWLYLSMSTVNAESFTESLTKSSAVYFTMTILSTVGFGDITPVGDMPRLVVTSQMVVGFSVLTVAIKTITTTTSTAIKRKHSKDVENYLHPTDDGQGAEGSSSPPGSA